MPDIVGIHLGMPASQAIAVLRREYPKARIDPWPLALNGLPSPPQEAYRADPTKVITQSVMIGMGGNSGCSMSPGTPDLVQIDFTPPPNPQAVAKVHRCNAPAKPMNRDVVLSAVRQKYGKETIAYRYDNQPAARDVDILRMYWLFDETGRPAPLPTNADESTLQCLRTRFVASGDVENLDEITGQAPGTRTLKPWCVSSGVGLIVDLITWGNDPNLIAYMFSQTIDVPLMLRELKDTRSWWLAELERLRREEIERSKHRSRNSSGPYSLKYY